jgi:hypothetical protein
MQEQHASDLAALTALARTQAALERSIAQMRSAHDNEIAALRHEVAGAKASLRRLEAEVEFDRDRLDQLRAVEFESTGSCEGGIIDFLTVKCERNVHEHGIVEITSSGTYGGQRPENAADLHTDTTFWSPTKPNQWICYDFKRMVVKPTHYAIRSGPDGGGCLKDWVVEGSMDGKDWIPIDERSNCATLFGPGASGTFTVNPVRKFRRVRLTQTGPSYSGQNNFVLAAFELFGLLIN